MIGSNLLARVGFVAMLIFALTAILTLPSSARGQFGNTISGVVYGLQRTPVSDVDVELLNELGQSIARTRTRGSGQYTFGGMGSGRFVIRVRPYRTDFADQDEEVEIINFSVSDGAGGTRTTGHAHEQRDIYLKLKRGVSAAMALGAIFVQDVPPDAKRLYERALTELSQKRVDDAFKSLRSALDIFPKYYAALDKLANEYIQTGDVKKIRAAEILLGLAVTANPRGVRSWYGLAYSQYSLGKHDEALASLDKLNNLDPAVPEALLLRGRLMKDRQNFVEAEKSLVKAKNIAKDAFPQIYWELALLYGNNLKRYGDAARELKMYVKLQPDLKDLENLKKLIREFELKAKN